MDALWAGPHKTEDNGCLSHDGDMCRPCAQVGAGTMNPATFLRVLGPEPWRVCYVEPSVRPDDSRYGDNPNRLQQHTQFQARTPCLPGFTQDVSHAVHTDPSLAML